MSEMNTKNVIEMLVNSIEPAVRLKTYLRLLDYTYENNEVVKIISTLKKSSSVIKNIFSFLPKDEKSQVCHPYTKWKGLHWSLALLADLGYPTKDHALILSKESELKWVASESHWNNKPTINNRKRFCASQEGNGLYSILSLGLMDERCHILANHLIDYQWPDGGWNCDTKPEAINSSYNESLIPLRALNVYAKTLNNIKAAKAIENAMNLFLKRKLFKSLSNNKIINEKWLNLAYPSYWHYNILDALKVIAEIGNIPNKNCDEALDIIESKALPTGGFSAELKYFQSRNSNNRYFSPVNWGEAKKEKMNEWITIDALYVLKKAKRIDIDY